MLVSCPLSLEQLRVNFRRNQDFIKRAKEGDDPSYQRSKMAAHHTMKRVSEFSTHMQQALIQSTSDDNIAVFCRNFAKNFKHQNLQSVLSVNFFGVLREEVSVLLKAIFHIIPRKAFILHHYLKKEEIYLVISNFFDCMFGCGSGHIITFATYKQLEPFGPIISIPIMGFVTYYFGCMQFFYDDIWSKSWQALIAIVFLVETGAGIKNLFITPPIEKKSPVFCNEERCVKCLKKFMQPFLSSTKICICVCESCPRRLDECTKCQSSPCTGTVEIKGPKSWWIAKSITISRAVNQSIVNPQRPKGDVD